jgi:hypothetical protein
MSHCVIFNFFYNFRKYFRHSNNKHDAARVAKAKLLRQSHMEHELLQIQDASEGYQSTDRQSERISTRRQSERISTFKNRRTVSPTVKAAKIAQAKLLRQSHMELELLQISQPFTDQDASQEKISRKRKSSNLCANHAKKQRQKVRENESQQQMVTRTSRERNRYARRPQPTPPESSQPTPK